MLTDKPGHTGPRQKEKKKVSADKRRRGWEVGWGGILLGGGSSIRGGGVLNHQGGSTISNSLLKDMGGRPVRRIPKNARMHEQRKNGGSGTIENDDVTETVAKECRYRARKGKRLRARSQGRSKKKGV